MRPFQPKQGPAKGLTPTRAFPVAAAGAVAGPAAWLDNVRFTPSTFGTDDWVYFTTVLGYQSPNAANALDGTIYRLFAISSDLSQWEIATGAYIRATGTFRRTNVLFNSAGTGTALGQSGEGARINFLTNPQVAVVAIKEDLLSAAEANSWSVAQQAQARANLAVQALGDFAGMNNGTLTTSVSPAGALTVSVKTFAGNDPSASDPVYFFFRDNTLPLGDFSRIAVTSALSVVLGAGVTLGATSATGLRVWIAAFNNGGVVQLAAINCSDANGVFAPQQSSKYTTTVPGSLVKTWYSTVAITSAAPWCWLGYCEWNSLTTAGAWVTPDIVQLFGPGIPLPGTPTGNVVRALISTNTNSSSTTFIATNLTANITPSSAANFIKYFALGTVDVSPSTANVITQMFRGATAIGPQNDTYFNSTTELTVGQTWVDYDRPNSTAQQTYVVAAKSIAGQTFNFLSGLPGTIILEEIMG